MLFGFTLISIVKLASQDPQFSQYYSSPLYLSPSLTGASEQTRMILNYRDQWPNIQGEFITTAFSIDHYLEKYRSGIGILVLKENEGGGLYNLTNLGVLYSYTIKVNRNLQLRPGFQFQSFNRFIDFQKMEFADQIIRNSSSSIELTRNERVQHYDLSTSLLAYSQNYWIGLTSDHLLSLSKALAADDTYFPIKLAAYGGLKFKLEQKNFLKQDKQLFVSFFYKSQAKFKQLDVGTYYENYPLKVGMWFRGIPVFKETAGLNAVILLFGYSFKNISINYSYDITTSRLITATGGAHEVSIAYQIDLNSKIKMKKKMSAVPCPQF